MLFLGRSLPRSNLLLSGVSSGRRRCVQICTLQVPRTRKTVEKQYLSGWFRPYLPAQGLCLGTQGLCLGPRPRFLTDWQKLLFSRRQPVYRTTPASQAGTGRIKNNAMILNDSVTSQGCFLNIPPLSCEAGQEASFHLILFFGRRPGRKERRSGLLLSCRPLQWIPHHSPRASSSCFRQHAFSPT